MPLFSVLLGFGVKAAAALSAAVVTGARRLHRTLQTMPVASQRM